VAAGAVVLSTGACGRLGLPASGYLYGTYENPTNAGDGYSMAYHAGAELTGIECFQINPLIKDYNGPACAYVANPFGGYQVNAEGNRFVDCDYWSGQMMAEVKRELDSARGPIYLKLSHLPDATISQLEGILHSTERPTRGTFHAGRGHDYRTHDVEMHISEIGLCSGHSASGVWVDEHAATTLPGLYAAGDLACVPHNYMLGAFVFGDIAGTGAAAAARATDAPASLPEDQILAAHELIYQPLRTPDGPPQPQVEYKLRRFVTTTCSRRRPPAICSWGWTRSSGCAPRSTVWAPAPARVDAHRRGPFHPWIQRSGPGGISRSRRMKWTSAVRINSCGVLGAHTFDLGAHSAGTSPAPAADSGRSSAAAGSRSRTDAGLYSTAAAAARPGCAAAGRSTRGRPRIWSSGRLAGASVARAAAAAPVPAMSPNTNAPSM